MMEKAQIIKDICSALLADDKQKARETACEHYPFVVPPSSKKNLTDTKRTQIFIRDGFIDRYTGEQLVYPGVLRLLSDLLPDEFPYHSNWKMSVSHIVYWDLYPTLDHVVPLARGGSNHDENLVCTSMIRNGIKANWLLDEVGWQKFECGDFNEWDGLIRWFVEYTEKHPQVLENKAVRKWHDTAKRCLRQHDANNKQPTKG